jgi:D-serine deaminase-like pyridoxal phosphate-dependent protein
VTSRPHEPDALPSPALIVDVATFDANVEAADEMVRAAAARKRIRPHVKTHRTAALALRQLTPWTSGLTCATVGEAEAMVGAGAEDVLIANEVIERGKLDRLAALAGGARVALAVDSDEGVAAAASAARGAGVELDALVDLDVGLGRCGVPGPDAAVRLGRAVERTPGLRLAGLMGYEGRRPADAADRARVIATAYAALAAAKEAFERAGLSAGVVSSAGTSTLHEAIGDPTITEIQAGTYALMEVHLDGLALPFVPACSVAATVISRTGNRAILDVGRKSIACDYGPPTPLVPGAELESIHEEHTTLRYPAAEPPGLGDRVALRPEHVRLTFNLHDAVFLAHADGSYERTPVSARGRSW